MKRYYTTDPCKKWMIGVGLNSFEWAIGPTYRWAPDLWWSFSFYLGPARVYIVHHPTPWRPMGC